MNIPESSLQHALIVGDLPGTPSEARAIECAYNAGFLHALAEVFSELEGMPPSIDAAQALTDLRQTYEVRLVVDDSTDDRSKAE